MIDEFFRKEMLGLPATAVLTEADIAKFKEMMGYVDAAFKAAYALGFLIIGYIIDRLGTKSGFSIALSLWSLAGVLNGFIGSVKGLSFTRFLLGLGESGNFPSAVKTVAEWFPKKERSLAAGLFNAGANIGIIVTAIAVPYITIHYGWRTAFIITGLLGFVVLIFRRTMYRKPEEHASVGKEELLYIQSDTDEIRVQKYRGAKCSDIGKRGLLLRVNLWQTPSSILISPGFRISSTAAKHWKLNLI